MNTMKINIHNNPNIGLYGIATDKYCLLGTHIPHELVQQMERILNVPVHQIKIYRTDLVGAFCAANDNCLIVPDIIFAEEKLALDKLGINYKIIKTPLTALGNNVLANNNGALVNPEFSAVVKKQIRQALGVKVVPGTIGELENVGSLGVTTKLGVLVSQDIHPREFNLLQTLLNTKIFRGTINNGHNIRSGLIANSFGFIFGDHLVGSELFQIQEALYEQ